jgi:predicted metal-binding membrane protein
MNHEHAAAPSTLLRRLTIPVGAAVVAVVALAWYVTWVSTDRMMMLTSPATIGSTDLALFFALIVVMMVAMMLPSAMPMAIAYHGLSRLEGGRPVKPADSVGTVMFVLPYFVVWGAFGVAALLGLVALGLMGSMLVGPLLFVPAATLVAAGLWQVTRKKEVCLSHCTSPAGFVLHHWRSGRLGAMRMGFRHSMYCIGCCWLFMLVLFISGSMSLLWMGGLSIAIFAEKLGVRTELFSRVIGVVLVGLGVLVAAGAILAM